MGRLERIAMKIAAPPPKIDFSGAHLYKPALEDSHLSKDWKKLFKKVLETREDVLLAIPDQRKLTDMRAFKNLKIRRGPLIDIVKHLMNAVKGQVPSADWARYDDAFDKLASYEFTMGQNLPHEASDWVFGLHGLISEMFRVVSKANPKTSSMIQRVAARVAFDIRQSFSHVDKKDIEKLFASDPSLYSSFENLMKQHDNFMGELYQASIDRLSDSMIRRLKFLRSGLINGLGSLMKEIKKRFPQGDFSGVESDVKETAGQEILNPNVMVRDMHDWTYSWHDAFTKLAYKAYESLMDEKNPRPVN